MGSKSHDMFSQVRDVIEGKLGSGEVASSS